MSDRICLQELSITASGKVYQSFGDNRAAAETAVVQTGEEFELKAVFSNSTQRAYPVSVVAELPGHYSTTKKVKQTHSITPGDSFLSWPVRAAKPDDAEQRISILVETVEKDLLIIDGVRIPVLAGPSQIAFTSAPFSGVVGETSPLITVELQNANGEAQKPAAPVRIDLQSSSKSGVFSPASITIPVTAHCATFTYQDSQAGTPEITAFDSTNVLTTDRQNFVIDQAETSVEVTCSPNPGTAGGAVKITATLTVKAPGTGTPTGPVILSCTSKSTGTLILPNAVNGNLTTASFTPPNADAYTVQASYAGDANFIGSTAPTTIFYVGAATAVIAGKVAVSGLGTAVNGVAVEAWDADGKKVASDVTKADGSYSLTVNAAEQVAVVFPAKSRNSSGQSLLLKSPGVAYVAASSAGTVLPDMEYELGASAISGTVMQQTANGPRPLGGVTVNLLDPGQPATVNQTTTDSQGVFSFNPAAGSSFTVRFPATVKNGQDSLALLPGPNGVPQTQTLVSPIPGTPFLLPRLIYAPQLAKVMGQVTDGVTGLYGIRVDLSNQSGLQTKMTDHLGFYEFSNLPPGTVQLEFASPAQDASGASWELQSGQQAGQLLVVRAGDIVTAAPVSYQPEQHSIEQLVMMDNRPAENILVDVRPHGSPYAMQAQRTGRDGKVTFVVPTAGQYEVRVYPDPAAYGGPQVSHYQVNSKLVATPLQISSPPGFSGSGMGASQAGKAEIDLQAYPILTEEVPAGVMPTTTRPGPAGRIGGASDLGQTADRAIREVLSWRTKSDDAKGFVAALGQAFDLKEVEGHTEWKWTPRSYTVQTDMGSVTGAQASLYTRAKVALDQSMPLLEGLYALVPSVEPEDLATVQSVVRSQFTALVNEFGTVGGPRVARVDELFELLLGQHQDPDSPPTKPEDIVKGSLGLIRQRYGLQRKFVTTVDDEQNLTNYLILVDYVIGLNHSWVHDKNYFIRNGVIPGTSGFSPFFGTQLVLLSRALDVVTQAVQDAYFAMDSVFMGDAERQVAQLNFAHMTQQINIPNPKTGTMEPLTFKSDTSGLFVAELLDWVSGAADEMRVLLQDAGKDGLDSLLQVTDRLRRFVHGAKVPPQSGAGLPPGYSTPRVQRAIRLLADGLDETYKLAVQLRPSDLPVDVSANDLRRMIREEMKKANQVVN